MRARVTTDILSVMGLHKGDIVEVECKDKRYESYWRVSKYIGTGCTSYWRHYLLREENFEEVK